MPTAEKDAPGVWAPAPVFLAASLAVGLLLEYFLPSPFLPKGVQYAVGFALIAISFAIVPFVLIRFRRARTPFDATRPTTVLVTDGVFRYSRNPGYLSMVMLYAGIAIVLDSAWLVALLVPLVAVLQLGVIRPEEVYLERKFGEEYVRYKSRVRCWF